MTSEKIEKHAQKLLQYLKTSDSNYFKLSKLRLKTIGLKKGEYINAVETLVQDGVLVIRSNTNPKTYIVNKKKLMEMK